MKAAFTREAERERECKFGGTRGRRRKEEGEETEDDVKNNNKKKKRKKEEKKNGEAYEGRPSETTKRFSWSSCWIFVGWSRWEQSES